ncbi:MAG: hypothetical protein NTW33_02120 [Methanoregula sp.]|nr:hypothetical protein [Methanoregula sp.]
MKEDNVSPDSTTLEKKSGYQDIYKMAAPAMAGPDDLRLTHGIPLPSAEPPYKVTSPADEVRNKVRNDFYGTLRKIRAEIENLRDSLDSIKKANAADKCDKRDKIFKPAWDENQKIIQANIEPVAEMFARFSQEIYSREPGGSELYDDKSDEVTRLENQWERFVNIWDRLGKSKKFDETAEFLGRIDDLDKLLCGMIFRINILTIPGRINDHFETLLPGQELNFSENFGDELCKKDDASPVLTYIKNHPKCINGVVNEEKGIIYKVDPRAWRRIISIAVIGVIWIVTAIGVFLLPAILSLTRYPFSITVPNITIANVSVTILNFASSTPVDTTITGYFLCVCYALVILGGLAHILIGGLKQAKSAPAGSRLAVEGWIRWFHINEQQNWAAALSLFVGFIFMIVVLKTADYVTAFFIGYSIDSIVELFNTRLDVAATAKTAEIKKIVSPKSTDTAT